MATTDITHITGFHRDDTLYIPFHAEHLSRMHAFFHLQHWYDMYCHVQGHYIDVSGPIPILRKYANTYSDAFANRAIYGIRSRFWGPLVPIGSRLSMHMRNLPGRHGDDMYGFLILYADPEP